MISLSIWENKKCSKPPTGWDATPKNAIMCREDSEPPIETADGWVQPVLKVSTSWGINKS